MCVCVSAVIYQCDGQTDEEEQRGEATIPQSLVELFERETRGNGSEMNLDGHKKAESQLSK